MRHVSISNRIELDFFVNFDSIIGNCLNVSALRSDFPVNFTKKSKTIELQADENDNKFPIDLKHIVKTVLILPAIFGWTIVLISDLSAEVPNIRLFT